MLNFRWILNDFQSCLLNLFDCLLCNCLLDYLYKKTRGIYMRVKEKKYRIHQNIFYITITFRYIPLTIQYSTGKEFSN